MLLLQVQDGLAPPRYLGRLVNAWSDEAGNVCTRFFRDGRRRWVDWPRLGVFGFDDGGGTVQFWPSDGVQSALVADTFARLLQPAILQALGWQTLHASAVAGPNGVLAFCGVKQSGKSTVAFALRRAGYKQLADDALVLQLLGDRVVVHALPFSPRLRDDARAYFEQAPLSTQEDHAFTTAPRVEACVILTRDPSFPEAPQLIRVTSAQAFSELLTHAHCFDCSDPGETRRIVDDYLEIAKRVPVYRLSYRPGLASVPRIAEMMLALDGRR
jgi:hypothetical protein